MNSIWKIVAIFLVGLALIVMIAIPVALGFGLSNLSSAPPEMLLPLLAIFGVVALLASLTIVSVAFSMVDLSDKTQALGLPEGTVRAVIALSLIVIFVITSVFLFGNLATPDTGKLTGLTQAQVDAIPVDQIVSLERDTNDATRFTVERVIQKSQASEDFANQVLTTVSTLVVSIAGFYFGTRAVAAARAGGAPVPPTIERIEPEEAHQGEKTDVKITGSNLRLANLVKLVQDSKEILATEVKSDAATIFCKFNIPEDAATGKWTLVVVNADGGEARSPGMFTITIKPAASSKSNPPAGP